MKFEYLFFLKLACRKKKPKKRRKQKTKKNKKESNDPIPNRMNLQKEL
jgi:hypothetical protein